MVEYKKSRRIAWSSVKRNKKSSQIRVIELSLSALSCQHETWHTCIQVPETYYYVRLLVHTGDHKYKTAIYKTRNVSKVSAENSNLMPKHLKTYFHFNFKNILVAEYAPCCLYKWSFARLKQLKCFLFKLNVGEERYTESITLSLITYQQIILFF